MSTELLETCRKFK